MTLYDPGPSGKMCFVYCGDDQCDCAAGPRYRTELPLGVPGSADPTTAGGGTEGLRAPPVSSIVDEAEQLAVSLTEAVLAAGLGFKGPFEDFAPIAELLLQDAIGAARRDGAQIANEAAAATIARASAEQARVEAERDRWTRRAEAAEAESALLKKHIGALRDALDRSEAQYAEAQNGPNG